MGELDAQTQETWMKTRETEDGVNAACYKWQIQLTDSRTFLLCKFQILLLSFNSIVISICKIVQVVQPTFMELVTELSL